MNSPRRIHEIADSILASNPGATVTSLLLGKIHRVNSEDPRLKNAQKDLDSSPTVQVLEMEQWGDGSWGRLHSRDTHSKQKVPTTEWAVERAIRLGVWPSNPILQHASDYLVSVIRSGQCHDQPEVNDRWPTGVRLFAASTLGWIDPEHPAISDTFDLWLEILRLTFKSGRYNAKAEIFAHQALTGASVAGSYLRLNNKYTVRLLGSRSRQIPEDLQIAFLKWLRSAVDGLLYLPQALSIPPPLDRPGPFEYWFRSVEILSEFDTFTRVFADPESWLWRMQGLDGSWDFGERLRSSPSLPLSQSWRRGEDRKRDWTTRVLILLNKIAG